MSRREKFCLIFSTHQKKKADLLGEGRVGYSHYQPNNVFAPCDVIFNCFNWSNSILQVWINLFRNKPELSSGTLKQCKCIPLDKLGPASSNANVRIQKPFQPHLPSKSWPTLLMVTSHDHMTLQLSHKCALWCSARNGGKKPGSPSDVNEALGASKSLCVSMFVPRDSQNQARSCPTRWLSPNRWHKSCRFNGIIPL